MSKNDQPDCLNVPWSHSWKVTELKREAIKLKIAPEKEVFKNIVEFLPIEKLVSLNCELMITRKSGQHLLCVSGKINAHIDQVCVQTLEPFSSEIIESFEAYFSDRDEAVPFSKAKKELFSKYGMDDTPILNEDEDPEPIINNTIDLGELCMQFLSLAVDSYPRKEMPTDKDKAEVKKVTGPVAERENPFAALKDWHKNRSE